MCREISTMQNQLSQIVNKGKVFLEEVIGRPQRLSVGHCGDKGLLWGSVGLAVMLLV